MWGTSWRQRLRLLPLFAAMTIADRLAPLVPPRRTVTVDPWSPGISVIIPDRDSPVMLAEALASLDNALTAITEPRQVIVVANGAPRSVYRDVEARFPHVEWVHDERPLGFAGAIERGLERVRHDGTFLMNNDMTVDARAIAELLPLRSADVFAIGVQIFQRNAAGRREETGFTDWYVDAAGVHLYHAPPPASDTPVDHLCASGGAALFRTGPLREYLRGSRAYDPFYWEDVEWGLRAWRDGLRVLFCPGAHATHRHRVTTTRFHTHDEIARIVERNRMLFDARHRITDFGREWLMARICELPYASQRELAGMGQAAGVFSHRLAQARLPQPTKPPCLTRPSGEAVRLQSSSYSYRMRGNREAQRPRILFVTPFSVFPPRHGGARRVAELIRGLRAEFDIGLVTDEATLYDARSFADFEQLYLVRLVMRKDEAAIAQNSLAQRMRTHCHPALTTAVDAALRDFRPDFVQIEHAELAPLVARRGPGEEWLLDLHDAYGPADFAEPAEAANAAASLRAFDALIVCSDEDSALVSHRRVECIFNGGNIAADAYRPSAGSQLLFVGPFRYAPNRTGIVEFLRVAWPAIRAAEPSATLLILGGDEHSGMVASEPAFAQPGVTVLGHRDDVPSLLAQSALTINPLAEIRGSAVKLAEALAAGRVCVSTTAGARGFLGTAAAGLVTLPSVAAMADVVIDLLADPSRRQRLEAPVPGQWDRFRWEHSVAQLMALCEDLKRPAADGEPRR
jgi:GT2 family glycosyltransferase/glycosyltransferase involved in cell wall biosynthesis